MSTRKSPAGSKRAEATKMALVRFIVLFILASSVCPSLALANAYSWPTLRIGSKGDQVKSLQYLLRAHRFHVGVTGQFGKQTEKCVKNFQTLKKLPSTGLVEGSTWKKLARKVSQGARGDVVRAVQSGLKYNGYDVKINGIYNKELLKLIKGDGGFQEEYNLPLTGIIDLANWCVLVGGKVKSLTAV